MYLTLKDLEKKASKVAAKAQKGVLAATTNNKKAPAKTGNDAETQKEVTQNESAKGEYPKDVANETTPAEVANTKEDTTTQVEEVKAKEATAPETEATTSEKVNTAENNEVVEPVVKSPVEETKTVENHRK